MSRMIGKRLKIEIAKGDTHLSGEWEIVHTDANDLALPYLAKNKDLDIQLWMRPRFHIGIVSPEDQTITELN